jgi:hypothetical protein
MIRTNRCSAAVLGLLLAAAACENDQLNRPFATTPVDPLFDRYVSMGNSITAGFQSGGINDSTQNQSYAVLLAQAMHAPFYVPLMRKPGCPPPFTNVFTQPPTRVGGGSATTCALRNIPANPPPFISNTAVPGAEVADIINNLDSASNANSLTQFFLGGLTQAQAMQRAQPTFVTIWIGNNDELGAATSSPNAGDTTKIVLTNFQARYTAMLDAVARLGRGWRADRRRQRHCDSVLQPGGTYWAIKNGLVPGAPPLPPAFTVSNNCALIASGIGSTRRLDAGTLPLRRGVDRRRSSGAPRNLDCADTVAAVVVPKELVKLVAAVTAYTRSSPPKRSRTGSSTSIQCGARLLRQVPTAVRVPADRTAVCRESVRTAFSCDAVHRARPRTG